MYFARPSRCRHREFIVNRWAAYKNMGAPRWRLVALWAELALCTQQLGPDIFTRGRILDCGRAFEQKTAPVMDWSAKFEAWPAIAAEINVDPAPAAEIGTNASSVYYAVALMHDQPTRVAHTETLLATHPRWRVFNSSSKHDVGMMFDHWRGMGLKMRAFKVSLGKVAWWWTCVRFCMLVLGSGHDYGVMLNDDVVVAADFEKTLEGHLTHFTAPMKFATYRLGQFDLGLVVSREAAARQLAIICDLDVLDHFHDHFTARTHRWIPKVVGNCPITYAGTPLEGMAAVDGHLHSHSNILSGNSDANEKDFLERVRRHDRKADGRPSFCAASYPGRIRDASLLGAWIHNDTSLNPDLVRAPPPR